MQDWSSGKKQFFIQKSAKEKDKSYSEENKKNNVVRASFVTS